MWRCCDRRDESLAVSGAVPCLHRLAGSADGSRMALAWRRTTPRNNKSLPEDAVSVFRSILSTAAELQQHGTVLGLKHDCALSRWRKLNLQTMCQTMVCRRQALPCFLSSRPSAAKARGILLAIHYRPAGKFLISVCSTTGAPPAGVYPSLRRMTSGFCPCAGCWRFVRVRSVQ